MSFKLVIRVSLFLLGLNISSAQADDERLAGIGETFSAEDRKNIGHFICGEPGYELTDEGLRCRACPSYTGQPGDSEGLYIDALIRSHFTSATANEVLLDTSGCEAHYANFGGAILLRELPQPGLANNVTLEFQYYQPGFRLNDCLTFAKPGVPSLLVCNEYWLGQGETIGHVSAIEITRQTITRWPLFRWYSNTATELEQVISVVPQEMKNIPLRGGEQQALQVTLSVIHETRSEYEKHPDRERNATTLLFVREGQRFFADDATRAFLGEINTLTRDVAE